MFEAAELGRKVPKADFKQREPELHMQLLEAQRELRGSNIPVIVIVSGVEGAGKGGVVSRLNEWLDARGIQTHAFWDETDEERERPGMWRYWRALPARGNIGIMFGSWYTKPIVDHAFGRTDKEEFDRALEHVATLENLLTDDHALIVKFWFHLSKKAQQKILQSEAKKGGKNAKGGKSVKASPLTKKFSKHYDDFLRISERAIRVTDTGECPWHVVESHDWRYRDLTVGTILLDAIRQRLKAKPRQEAKKPAAETTVSAPVHEIPGADATVLDSVDLSSSLDEKDYTRTLRRHQSELWQLAWRARQRGLNVVAVFEGWDAAGKGGAIRRTTAAMDARLYRVISVAAPTDEEKAQHYLWRFWRHVPRAGYVTIYDRSWYGRVLVERVEAFAQRHEWMRAYREINDFEEQLTEHGIVLMKFWVHLSPDEQLRRFKEREQVAWKKHKITDEDWRNRKQWDAYSAAVNDMVARTSTKYAPWTIVAGDDKRYARVQVLKTFRSRLKDAL